MRLFYFLLPLISFPALSVPPACDESDLVPGDQIGVCTSLTIDSNVTIPAASGLSRIFITGLTGPVLITANITIDGGDGTFNVAFGGGGNGPGGPGAHDGGGHGFGGQENGGVSAGPDGKTHLVAESPCSSGGGGAGFAFVGSRGEKCATSTLPANGGAAALLADFDFTALDFRGGFGGAAGGLGDDAHVGTGGGGGGALHIETSGTITIGPGVTISAIGGAGGIDTTNGGGGGAGSGGAIWLIGGAGVVNQGTINVSGGTGGRNNATGAHGGDGSSGVFRIESAGIITNGTGVSSPASASTPSLKSEIACGTIAKQNEKQNLLFQMMIGFVLAMMLGTLRFFQRRYRST